MANGSSRPLSPHLQVYRFQWTMAGSITHRITGVGLTIGTLLL
ncbi:MAG TPA: succinate:quinone oxidoreductase subunit C, partial [Azospirillum sp.]|nr:succinate:quinone oxidoreductase subunit C [Azospirillum sp.]